MLTRRVASRAALRRAGANNSIQYAGVQYILDSVVDHLLADPLKRRAPQRRTR
jgi:hypothetical protein